MIFNEKDLDEIRENTDNNNHGENYEFIAKKINSPLERHFKKINEAAEKDGYLSENLSIKRRKLYLKLFNELKKKYPEEYEEVHSRT